MNNDKVKRQGWKTGEWVAEPYVQCKFDAEVERLGLTEDQFRQSEELKEWVKNNAQERYVPEYLLDFWGVVVDLGVESRKETIGKGRIRLPIWSFWDEENSARESAVYKEFVGNKELSKY